MISEEMIGVYWVMSLQSKQHKLLKILNEQCLKHLEKKETIPALSYEEIYKKLNNDWQKLNIIGARLYSEKEIHPYDVGGVKGLCILEAGATAYSERKYKIERNNYIIGRLKDYLGITTAFIAIGTTIVTALFAITSVNKNQLQIEKLENKLNKMQLKSTNENQTKSLEDSLYLKK